MPGDGTYAPQSPDLSSFLSSTTPVQQQHQHQHQHQLHQHQTSTYTPRSPRLPDFTSPQSTSNAQRSSISSGSGYQVPPSPQQYQGFGDSRRNSSYLPPIPDLPPAHTFDSPGGQGQYTSPAYQAPTVPYSQTHSPPQNYSRQSYSLPQQALTYQPPPPQLPQAPYQELHEQLHIKSETSDDTMTGRVKRERVAAAGISEDVKPHLGPSQGIDIKTKFPVARIKRIMQADEEVGKVAQVTPVAVSKALELFMISLVTKSASLARSTNSKRVTAVHLKKAIEADEQFDFLNDIVSKIADGPDAGQGKRTKEEEDGSDSDEKPKKKGRRKKGE
ncbi:hypothetical protein V493_03557 [Pseudogymnoascus sp. VKM F-4281 (FW-2241)]|nr:hypothetical protein V493_03557 [Pseudogymnoascus sp. VKM F-4281 (FW-2241)]